MFWGLVLEPGKRYSTTVDKAFHVSMACLDCASVNSDHEVLYVLLENDGQEYRICNLSKKGCFQVNLDLSFMTGDSIAFELKGSGIVHLSGYILPEDDDDDFPGDEDDEDLDEAEDEEEESVNQKMLKGSKKALANALQNAKKMQKMEESDDDDDEDDDDDDDDDLSEADDDDDDDDDEEEEDDDDDEDDDDEEEEDLKQKILALKKGGPQANKKGQSPAGKLQTTPGQQKGGKPQTPSGKPQTPGGKPQTPGGKPQTPAGKPQTPAGKMLNGTSPDNQQQSGKKRKRRSKGGAAAGGEPQSPAAQAPQQPNSQQKPNKAKKQRMSNGLTIKDLKVGNGPVAKPGQTVAVWYEGRLQSTGRTFDACRRNGAPFRFRLGRSEVIRAWDEGVAGMQVGGQRRITCPPHLAYGSRGAPPAIPPNSTLVFQVELKSVQ